MTESKGGGVSRRELLYGGAAVAGAAMVGGKAVAQPAARWVRHDIASADGKIMLESYRTAVRAMLKLDADNPHNWYRIAFSHFLDCPHGNWWFLPWHRGFMGHVEQIVRKYSGNPDFAFPYWDWTKNPEVPADVYGNVLDPADSAFESDGQRFRERYERALRKAGYWIDDPKPSDGGLDTQFGQLLVRGIRFTDDVWFDVFKNPNMVAFFPNAMYPQGRARGILGSARGLDTPTKRSVSLSQLLRALSPRDFVTFASERTKFHSNVSGFGILEGQPHNKVHNNVGGLIYDDVTKQTANHGGFMQNNLSPVDPLFFLHHSNMDRLWDVWTRKQRAYGDPYLPDGAPASSGGTPIAGSPYAQWAAERFLFFVDANGRPAPMKAGDCAAIGSFDYRYTRASGEEVVPTLTLGALFAPRQRKAIERVRALATDAQPGRAGVVAPSAAASVAVKLPASFHAAGARGPLLFAKVTLVLPHGARGELFDILVHRGNAAAARLVDTVSMFGGHGADHGPVTFTVALSPVLPELGGMRVGDTLFFTAVPSGGGHAAAGHGGVEIVAVTVEAH